jgi:hypothetical protein
MSPTGQKMHWDRYHHYYIGIGISAMGWFDIMLEVPWIGVGMLFIGLIIAGTDGLQHIVQKFFKRDWKDMWHKLWNWM